MESVLRKFKGSLKLLILYVLEKEPLHGYAIMQKLSELFSDYKPSAGIIYPTLSSLKKSGLIETVGEGKREKKTYRITENGKKYLEEHKKELERVLNHSKVMSEFFNLGGRELRDAIFLMIKKFPELNDEQKEKLGELMRKCAREIKFIVEFGGD